MTSRTLTRPVTSIPSLIEDLFKPLNIWFDDPALLGKVSSVPAVNVVENPSDFILSFAVPGMAKEDFQIDVEGDLITISVQKEENIEKKDEKFTRREYNYSSFTRSFTLPENVRMDLIEAKYEDGILKLILPKKEVNTATVASRQIMIK